MNIVLAMAGKGSRFADMGYKLPKPLIDVCGKPMIERVVDNILRNIASFEDPIINFLCLEDFINQYGKILVGIMSKYKWVKYKIISVKQVTQGAACTVLLAKELINNDQELIITDCDHIDLSYCWLINGISFF
jgi:NDP-sugar pyrophosphorylase family protein